MGMIILRDGVDLLVYGAIENTTIRVLSGSSFYEENRQLGILEERTRYLALKNACASKN